MNKNYAKKYGKMMERYYQIGKETGKDAAQEFSAETIEYVIAEYRKMLECNDGAFHNVLLVGDDDNLRDYWEARYEEDPVLRGGDDFGRLSEAAYQHLLGWVEAVEEATE